MLKTALVGIIFLYFFNLFLNIVYILGFHKTTYTHWPGPCRNVAPIETGSEDIALASNGLAFISSGLSLDYQAGHRFEHFIGRIFLFDFNRPENDAIELTLNIDFDFVPHGVDLLEDKKTGEIRLFVVNHRDGSDSVEIFLFQKEKSALIHVRSVQHALFKSLNDVLAIDVESFYVTNDGFYRNSSLRIVERYTMRPWGSVVYFDGSVAKKVAPDSFEPNGLGMSPDKTVVYVNQCLNRVVNIYSRKEDNSLEFMREIKLGTLPDNMFVNPENGEIWLGCLHTPHVMVEHMKDPRKNSPSQVVLVRPLGPQSDPFQEYKLFEMFVDDGSLISTVSGVAYHKGRLLLGSVLHKLAFCEILVPLV